MKLTGRIGSNHQRRRHGEPIRGHRPLIITQVPSHFPVPAQCDPGPGNGFPFQVHDDSTQLHTVIEHDLELQDVLIGHCPERKGSGQHIAGRLRREATVTGDRPEGEPPRFVSLRHDVSPGCALQFGKPDVSSRDRLPAAIHDQSLDPNPGGKRVRFCSRDLRSGHTRSV